MKASILYISYTGLLDPLGQSQVLQYVIGLAPDYQMTLLTFEKPEALRDGDQLSSLAKQCRQAGIDWHYLQYHHRPTLPATLYDMVMGVRRGRQLARSAGAQVVHCRSYLAGLMGLLVKGATGARHLFDMRGFWVDERVDGGSWRKESFIYRFFKRLERVLFTHTDHVVSLTRSGASEIAKLRYLGVPPPVSVIPTCTNLDMFQPHAKVSGDNESFTLGYVGSAGSWYMFGEVARVVKLLFETCPASRFLVINRGSHSEIHEALLREGVDQARVDIKAVKFADVSNEIAKMDAGVFFIKPVWSKRASSPTRLGEFLACGKPVLTNGMVGDVEADVNETRTGVVINEWKQETLEQALAQLVGIAREEGIAARCRSAATERFSLQTGIARYAAIYTSLLSDNKRSTD
ncbi:MAG: glycosyltransferase [Halioglobus sp.]|nr:glycosyltransferase [Halioglobus sp.]